MYDVSNLGNIRSYWFGKCKQRKLIPNRSNGYLYVFLSDGKTRTCHTVHRLVASAFCPRKSGCDFINHIDENKHNNSADNLEWCTKAYNNTYNGKTQRCCKSIEQLDDSGAVIKIWRSAREADKETGANYKNISAVCRGLRPRAGGFRWRFLNE